MAVRRRRNSHSSTTFAAFFTFLLFSFFTTTTLAHLGRTESGRLEEELRNEKRLGGPGSSPPSCRWKCGGCSPCKPVHVPVHPGVKFTMEYYPEAWRCKCGNKLFMP
ncbi:EPIDERMAL PATTERNING FACTOR-like protein 4 [Linum grandiflorum]